MQLKTSRARKAPKTYSAMQGLMESLMSSLSGTFCMQDSSNLPSPLFNLPLSPLLLNARQIGTRSTNGTRSRTLANIPADKSSKKELEGVTR